MSVVDFRVYTIQAGKREEFVKLYDEIGPDVESASTRLRLLMRMASGSRTPGPSSAWPRAPSGLPPRPPGRTS